MRSILIGQFFHAIYLFGHVVLGSSPTLMDEYDLGCTPLLNELTLPSMFGPYQYYDPATMDWAVSQMEYVDECGYPTPIKYYRDMAYPSYKRLMLYVKCSDSPGESDYAWIDFDPEFPLFSVAFQNISFYGIPGPDEFKKMKGSPVEVRNTADILAIEAVNTLEAAYSKDIFCSTLTPEVNADVMEREEALFMYYKFPATCNDTDTRVEVEGFQVLDVCGQETKVYGLSGLKFLPSEEPIATSEPTNMTSFESLTADVITKIQAPENKVETKFVETSCNSNPLCSKERETTTILTKKQEVQKKQEIHILENEVELNITGDTNGQEEKKSRVSSDSHHKHVIQQQSEFIRQLTFALRDTIALLNRTSAALTSLSQMVNENWSLVDQLQKTTTLPASVDPNTKSDLNYSSDYWLPQWIEWGNPHAFWPY